MDRVGDAQGKSLKWFMDRGWMITHAEHEACLRGDFQARYERHGCSLWLCMDGCTQHQLDVAVAQAFASIKIYVDVKIDLADGICALACDVVCQIPVVGW